MVDILLKSGNILQRCFSVNRNIKNHIINACSNESKIAKIQAEMKKIQIPSCYFCSLCLRKLVLCRVKINVGGAWEHCELY